MLPQSQPIADVSASLTIATVPRTSPINSASREASWNHYTLKRLSRDYSKVEVSFRQSWYAKASEKVEVEVSPVLSVGPTVKRLSQFRHPARLLRENGRTAEYMESSNGLDEEKNESEVAARPRTLRPSSAYEVQGKDVQALWSHAYTLPDSKFCVGKSRVIDPESEPGSDESSSQSPRNRSQSDPSSAQVNLEDKEDNASISQSSTYAESTEASFSLPFSREDDEQLPSPSLSTTATHEWELVDGDDSCKEQNFYHIAARMAAVAGGTVKRNRLRKEPKSDQSGKAVKPKTWYLTAKKHLNSLKPSGKLANSRKKARPTSPNAEHSHYLSTHIMQAKMRPCSSSFS